MFVTFRKQRPYINCASTHQLQALGINIALISAPAYSLNAYSKHVTIGSTSMWEIDHMIEDKSAEQLETSEEEIRAEMAARLPQEGWADLGLANFSRAGSDTLPPHQDADHDIKLQQENTLTNSPLYSMTLAQLTLTREYLREHLQKGSIEPSDAGYAL